MESIRRMLEVDIELNPDLLCVLAQSQRLERMATWGTAISVPIQISFGR